MSSLQPQDVSPRSRRDFFKRAGLGFGVIASATALQACDSDGVEVPNEGVLRGFVVYPDGEPLEGATISVEGVSATATTDADGYYQFDDLPTGQYTVTAEAFGAFEAQTAQVNVVRGGTGYTQNFNYGDTLPTVTFDFSSDIGVLNYAYALEQLEAAFYASVTGADGFADLFDADEQTIFLDLAAHEAIHRDFLAAALGGSAIPGLIPDFNDIDFGDRTAVLATAQTFEDLGVGAYNGAGQYLTDPTFLTLAGKIVSVEARHASVISGLISANSIAGDGAVDANGLDQALAPTAVLAAADPFLFNTVSVSNLPA